MELSIETKYIMILIVSERMQSWMPEIRNIRGTIKEGGICNV